MKDILGKLLPMLEAGKHVVLVTVVETRGSSPRKAGARMLVAEEGLAAGTVGGGAIEYQAIALAMQMQATEGCFLREFVLTNEQAGSIGMICGGWMKLLFQCVLPEERAFFAQVQAALNRREAYLVVELATGRMRLEQQPPEGTTDCFVEKLCQSGITYVFGGGHVAQALVPLLVDSGFDCLVMDDRDEFVAPDLFPRAHTQKVNMTSLPELSVGNEDHALIMTRGHEHDFALLCAMLRTSAGYIGMMGSRHKRAIVYARLKEHGFVDSDIQRIVSPIGLSIGAETPFEIAVSIAAQLIAFRAEREGRVKG